MKATMFAMAFLLPFLSLPIQAAPKLVNPPAISSTEKSIKKIDLNQADVKQLTKSFKGIGRKRAEAIVKYRENHNGFKSVEELSQVPRLGKQFVKNNLTQLQDIFTVG